MSDEVETPMDTVPATVGFVTPLTATVTEEVAPTLEADSVTATPEPLGVTPETLEPVTV